MAPALRRRAPELGAAAGQQDQVGVADAGVGYIQLLQLGQAVSHARQQGQHGAVRQVQHLRQRGRV